MKRLFSISFALCLSFLLMAQEQIDWAGLRRYRDANDALTVRPAVVLMGNSITDFWPNHHPDFFQSHNLVGRGISGQVSAQMLCRFQQDVIALRPKAVVILCGTNDIACNNGLVSVSGILQNIRSMVQISKANKIRPILCTVPPCSSFYWHPEIPSDRIPQLNEGIRELARKEHIALVDYYDVLAMRDQHGHLLNILPTEFSEDGVHPNAAGYTAMERVLLPAIRKYCK